MTTFYHGTSLFSAEQIKENGFSTDLVFLTPRKDIAEEYGEEVVTVSVEEANAYLDHDDWSVRDYINQGYSVCVKPEFITIK